VQLLFTVSVCKNNCTEYITLNDVFCDIHGLYRDILYLQNVKHCHGTQHKCNFIKQKYSVAFPVLICMKLTNA